MCDTLYLSAARAAGGRALFGKNSDRERNEAQSLEFHPARPPAKGRMTKATYVRVPDPGPAFGALLSRPFWGFGAEMGVNERGVAIGNEAVIAAPDLPAPQSRGGLTGMDLVRLALARSGGAAEALHTITALLAAHGQGGDCGHLTRFRYHNAFLIADGEEAFVLETVGRDWVAERAPGARAISNAYSIAAPDAGESPGFQDLLGAGGGPGARTGQDGLAGRLQDPARARSSCAEARAARSRRRLDAPGVDVGAMMGALRDHGDAGDLFDPARSRDKTVCMHAGARGRRSQTVASMIGVLGPKGGLAWATAAAAPCLSVFRPVFLDVAASGFAPDGPAAPPTDRADSSTRWWRHERLHRGALSAFKETLDRFAPARDDLEGRMIRAASALADAPQEVRARAQATFWAEADALEATLLAQGAPAAPRDAERDRTEAAGGAYARSWIRLNRAAGLDI